MFKKKKFLDLLRTQKQVGIRNTAGIRVFWKSHHKPKKLNPTTDSYEVSFFHLELDDKVLLLILSSYSNDLLQLRLLHHHAVSSSDCKNISQNNGLKVLPLIHHKFSYNLYRCPVSSTGIMLIWKKFIVIKREKKITNNCKKKFLSVLACLLETILVKSG